MSGANRGLLALGILLVLGGVAFLVASQAAGSGLSGGGIDGIVAGLLVALGIVVVQRSRSG